MAVHQILHATIACCLGVLPMLGQPSPGRAEATSGGRALLASNHLLVTAYAEFITEASRRFAIPERWISAVMRVESGANAHAISSRGALGLMQIMPETWVELSFRYELGSDRFDPHDNILAGTGYLREMMDRFGSEGFLAAYNAGPKRYEEHLTSGRPLPDETQAYVTRLAPLIDIEQRERGTPVGRRSGPWPQASVFLARIDGSPNGGNLAPGVCTANAPNAVSKSGMTALIPRASGLFVRRSDKTLPR